jgi:hypothetical protein
MHWDIFDALMTDLMPVIDKCEAMIELHGDLYQRRAIAFLSERFFNLFLFHHRISQVEAGVVLLDVPAPTAASGRGMRAQPWPTNNS